jgi:hypothetical protein
LAAAEFSSVARSASSRFTLCVPGRPSGLQLVLGAKQAEYCDQSVVRQFDHLHPGLLLGAPGAHGDGERGHRELLEAELG